MVCLHGLGDTYTNYRNALIQSLAWHIHFPNTIFICPEAATTTSDFFQNPGDETIIDSCMKYAMSNYHIDSADVILQGFSLGGRAALRYGLDNYTKFKALLLNTPAIQGVKNALNGQPTYLYKYKNASHIPIYITHGVQDVFYEPPIDSALKLMIEANGMVRYNDVQGIGHTIPNFSQMSDVLSFFNLPARAGSDLELFELEAPARTILAGVSPGVLVRNAGDDTITSVKFEITLNGKNQFPYIWRGSLAPFNYDSIALPAEPLWLDQNILDIRVDTINGNVDTFTKANQLIDTISYVSKGLALPVSEGFEEDTVFPPPGWLLQLAGDVFSPWFQDTVRKSGSYSAGAFNSIFFFDNAGRAEGLVSPVVDLTSVPDPQLSFDLAYNDVRYTPPYFTGTVNFADTLDVLISTDGGITFTSLFRKAGASLATFSAPTLNPLSYSAVFIQPADSNWRHYTINLSQYATAPEAMVKFNYISGLGGSIYIDNVEFSGPLDVRPASAVSFQVYPNPATDWVAIVGTPNSESSISVMDAAGREVLSWHGRTNAAGDITLDTRDLAPGIYFMHATLGNETTTTNLAIIR